MILFDSNLVMITFDVDDGKFRLERNDGSVHVSRITDVEEVSYVSSPYLPSCLMRNEAVFSSNARKAGQCRQGVNAIKDELSFAIVLSNVRVMVGEWIPFGPNQIVSLNDRLGSLERCQGGLFTSELDLAPTSTRLQLNPGLTKIAIVDFEFDSFTNFEADIQGPNDDGIVQIENFGMHLSGDGTIVYGMYIDAIMDRPAEAICVDHLARLLVDVDMDSSKIIDDLLSPHQRGLMDMLFMKDAASRSKFNLITARAVVPKLPVREYLDRGEKENELKQVLGEIHAVYDLSDDDKILVGRDGMLLVGPNANQHEPLILAYLALLSRELFVRFFFKRTFILDDILNRARAYMKNFEMNPEALSGMRARVDQCSHDLVVLEEILGLLRESMRAMKLPKCPGDASGVLLYEQLQLRKVRGGEGALPCVLRCVYADQLDSRGRIVLPVGCRRTPTWRSVARISRSSCVASARSSSRCRARTGTWPRRCSRQSCTAWNATSACSQRAHARPSSPWPCRSTLCSSFLLGSLRSKSSTGSLTATCSASTARRSSHSRGRTTCSCTTSSNTLGSGSSSTSYGCVRS